MKQYLSGNEAAAIAAIHGSATVITGYPGTPSSEVIGSIWGKKFDGVEVQWSVNEKVAFEIAAAASWAGKNALCTMKMSGLNVAYDSLISVMYSGCTGALVLYVCDDPGVSAGMPEQDVRGFALMSDMAVLEPVSVADTYDMVRFAFKLSHETQSPVMVRSVTNVALSHAVIDLPESEPKKLPEAHFEHNIEKYTKAGAKICMDQHRDLIARLSCAQKIIHENKINKLELVGEDSLGIIAVGVSCAFLDEALNIASRYADVGDVSTLRVKTSHPLPAAEITRMLNHCGALLIVEENEPYVENGAIRLAYKNMLRVPIYGKHTDTFSRIGSFDARLIAKGILKALEISASELDLDLDSAPEALCAKRPIGVCAGCPHRGVYMAINSAMAKAGIKKDEMLVTGDIGCTILGMSPPFNTLSTEVAMGASVAMAQGFIYAGIKTPMISTMGDSTFLHAGIPPLINAVQNNVNMTAIIMDNGWTSMTGMQVNANTDISYQQSDDKHRVDIAKIVPALGVEKFYVADPYDVEGLEKLLLSTFNEDGVKVILTRRECAIQAGRKKIKYAKISIDPNKCTRCKLCITKSGCPALVYDGERVYVDQKTCIGCAICEKLCNFKAIKRENI